MSNPLTTETLEELERLYGRLQAITDHPLEVDQDADEPAIIYVHSRGEKCADGRHHTYMVGLSHMSEDWKDDGRPLADAVVAIINAFPALLAAARERETLRAQLWEEAARYLDAREAIAIWKVQIVTLRTRVSALEGALRETWEELNAGEHWLHAADCSRFTLDETGAPTVYSPDGPCSCGLVALIDRVDALLTPTPETP